MSHFDELMNKVGSNGPWQMSTVVQTFLIQTFLAMPLYQQNYLLAGNMDYKCVAYEHERQQQQHFTLTGGTKQINETNTIISDQCRLKPADSLENPCTKWNYTSAYYNSTLVSEFDLVCDRAYLVPIYKSTFLVGFLMGVWFWGAISDTYGRFLTIIITVPLQLVASVVTLTSYRYSITVGVRLLEGVAYAGSMKALFVLSMEIVRPTMRNGVAVFFGLASPAAGALVSLLGLYIERDWRKAHLYATIVATVALPLSLLLSESPRWLIINKRHVKAKKIFKRIAWINQTPLPEDIDKSMQAVHDAHVKESEQESNVLQKTTETNKKREAGCRKLLLPFTERTLRRRTFALSIVWFVVGMVFYGSTFYSTGQMNSNPFITLLITSVTRILWAPLLVIIINYSGKKLSLTAACVAAGLSLIALALLIKYKAASWQLITLVVVAITSINSALEILYIFTSELYPTLVRQSGLALCSMAARVGAIISPFIADSVGLWWQPAPAIVFAIACFVAVGSTWVLPEMNNKVLPDTVRDTTEVEEAPPLIVDGLVVVESVDDAKNSNSNSTSAL